MPAEGKVAADFAAGGGCLSLAGEFLLELPGAQKSVVWRGGREAEGNGLLNRRTGECWYRGFESRPLRSKRIKDY